VKEGGIQVLASLAPSSQTVGSLFRVIHEQAKHNSRMTEVNINLTRQQSLVRGRGNRLGEGEKAVGWVEAFRWLLERELSR